jgi:deleted-in-malignant-brain-tumors protein 1
MTRLAYDGSRYDRGRVEIYHPSYKWGTVCDDSWDITDGHVVCRQLGFTKATAVYGSAHYGQGSGNILLDDLGCTGYERYLWDCSHRGWKKHNCGHREDASVVCA